MSKRSVSLTQAERNAQVLETSHLMSDLGRRTARGGVIAIVAQFVRLSLMLTTSVVMARLLEPGDFGLVAMAATVTSFVGLFTDLGLSAATVQRQQIDQNTVSALFYINLAMGGLIAVMGCLMAPVAAWGFGDDRIFLLVIGLALTIPITAASAQHGALLQRGMRWITIQWTGISAQLIGAMTAITLAWRTDIGYWALVADRWVVAICGLILVWFACPWRPTYVRRWRDIRSSLTFGMNLTGFNFINYFHRQFDKFLIGWCWGPVQLGFYTRAYGLMMMPLSLINGPVGSAVIPSLSRLQNNPPAWSRAYTDALLFVVLISAPLASLLIILAPDAITILFGPKWTSSIPIFQALSVSLFAQPIMSSTGWLWISTGNTARMLKWSIICLPIFLLTFVISALYGAFEVALGYSIIFCCLTPLCTAFAAKTLPIRLQDVYKPLVWPIASALIAMACIVFMNGDHAISIQNAIYKFIEFCSLYIILILFPCCFFKSYRQYFSVKINHIRPVAIKI